MASDKNSGEPGGDTGPQMSTQAVRLPRQRSGPPAPRSGNAGGGLGCALAGIVVLLVIVLVGVALFLPPFSVGERLFGTPFAALNGQSPSASQGLLKVSVSATDAGSGFGVRLRQIAPDVVLGKSTADPEDVAFVQAAKAALPTTLTLISPVYKIDRQGTTKAPVSLAFTVPEGHEVTQLDLYAYDTQAARWQFVPAHSPDPNSLVAQVVTLPNYIGLFESARLAPVIGVNIDIGQALTPAITGVANVIHPAGLQPAVTGALQGVLPAGVELGKGYAVVPVIRNFTNPAALDLATITTLLQNSSVRAAHIDRLLEFATSKAYQGLAIDYRGVPPEQRDNFTAFISTLADKLHNANLTLTVVVPFPTQDGTTYNTGAYDWQALGASADSLQILMPLDPQDYADVGLGVVTSGLRWATGEVNRARLQVALSLMSVQETAGSFTPIAYGDALAPLGQVAVKPAGVVAPQTALSASLSGYAAQFVPLDSSGAPSIKYFAPDGTLAGTMWLTTESVVANRLARFTSFNLAGIAVLDLASPGIPGQDADVLSGYKVNQPANAKQSPLALHWTVMSQGKLVSEITAAPGTPFAFKPDASSDNVQVNVELIGARGTLGPAVVRVASATPTPTVTPTFTLTPSLTPTPTDTRTPTPFDQPTQGG